MYDVVQIRPLKLALSTVPNWVDCSTLAVSYLGWGISLCRQFSSRTRPVFESTVLESHQDYDTTPVYWCLSRFNIEVYALVPKTLNLFTPPSGMIVIFI